MKYIPRCARAPHGFQNPPETNCPCPICGRDVDFRQEAYEKIGDDVYHEKCLDQELNDD